MTAESIRVSVVMPVYNQARYLDNAIKSVLIQIFTDYELIVVDDGSTDNCQEVVAQFGNRVRYIWQENQGLAVARNTGIRAARGDTIALLDSDDAWLPGFLDRMMQLVAQQPDAVVYSCRARCIDSDSSELPQLMGPSGSISDDFYEKILRANSLIPSTILMHKSAIVAAGLFDEAYRRLQDWELWIRLLQEGHRFAGIPDVLVHYRVHSSNLSTDATGGQQAAMALAVKHFGPDDGLWQAWSREKRLAYGGVYRYHLLTSVQGQNDWGQAGNFLHRALRIDPSLALDFELYYQLVMGTQPPGYWGTSIQLTLKENASKLSEMLSDVFNYPIDNKLISLKPKVYGTAHSALGLLAYNTGHLSTSRHHLLKALCYQPELCREKWVMGNIAKTIVGSRGLSWAKHLQRQS